MNFSIFLRVIEKFLKFSEPPGPPHTWPTADSVPPPNRNRGGARCLIHNTNPYNKTKIKGLESE